METEGAVERTAAGTRWTTARGAALRWVTRASWPSLCQCSMRPQVFGERERSRSVWSADALLVLRRRQRWTRGSCAAAGRQLNARLSSGAKDSTLGVVETSRSVPSSPFVVHRPLGQKRQGLDAARVALASRRVCSGPADAPRKVSSRSQVVVAADRTLPSPRTLSLASHAFAGAATDAAMSKDGSGPRRAYVTLLTNARYLPGLVRRARLLRSPILDLTARCLSLQLLLDHTMKQVDTRYPLVVLTTPSFLSEHLDLLETLGMETRRIELLEPKGEVKLIAERFKDTWSKLQAFALEEYEVRTRGGLLRFPLAHLARRAARRSPRLRHDCLQQH